MRVVHLDDDDPQHTVAVAAQEEAGRVEDVARHAQVGDERDLPAAGILAVRTQVVDDPRPDVDGRRVEVVLVAEGDEARPVAPEQPERPVHLVQLVEIERGVEHAVLEPVRERAGPPVADDAVEQVRPHAARSSAEVPAIAASAAAASNPDRQPSSWKP